MAEEKKIDFTAIEKKWQKKWEEKKAFKTEDKSKKQKFYCLEMYPYPSASFLHVGHVRNYTIGDVIARFKRMQGFSVLYPMGYDSFGLPAENASKKAGIHPKKYTEDSIKQIMKYQKALGNSYDWDRVIASHEPEYYKWNQYFFLKFLEKGLAYRKKAPVNWCPKCESVLANEESEGGKCWRCNSEVVKKDLEQWFFKITDYADRLLEDAKKLEWPEKIKIMQENWIGKSHGIEIDFEIFEDIKNKEFVFLHAYGDTMDNAFWNWLKKEIESRGGKIAFAKDLPNTNNPKYEEQSDFLLKSYKFSENSVVIGHSLGNVLIMKLLSSGKIKINKLIMVAPPLPNKEDMLSGRAFLDKKPRPALAGYCDWKFNFDKIRESAKKISVLADKKDHIVPINQPIEVANKLEAKLIISIGNKTHFNGELEEEVLNLLFNKWPIFTTRPDTIYGVTFMVVSAQHPKLFELVTEKQKKEVLEFVEKSKKVKSQEEIEKRDKEGVFTGSYASNPLTNEKVPVYAGNFVLADYGSGMVMAVPAHDQRDWEFALKYKIPIKQVIGCPEKYDWKKGAYTDWGNLVDSDKFNGLRNDIAKEEITKYLSDKKLGRKTTNYKIRDWLISRQRYWGTPIPVIYCDKCGMVPVPEKDLPVELPEKVDFKEKNVLASNEKWLNVKCPKCEGKGRRETDTMGGFVDSSWYFLRYCDNKNKKEAFDKKKVEYWMPVDQYIGGAEHAVMHLMYARFFIKALKDLGFVKFDEPFKKLFNQGIVYKDGNKMSKSAGNVVYQTDISDKYGIDTARLFLMFVSSPDKQMEWSDSGVEGAYRIINRLIALKEKVKKETNEREENKIHSAIKKVTAGIEQFEYPKAIIAITEAMDSCSEAISKKNYEVLLKLISPFCPHIAEELWEKMGNKGFISLSDWPVADESKINLKLEEEEKKVDKLGEDILNIVKIIKERENKPVEKAYIYTLPKELEVYSDNLELLKKKTNLDIKIFAVNDKNKHDPEGKAGKAKPNKPAVYLE